MYSYYSEVQGGLIISILNIAIISTRFCLILRLSVLGAITSVQQRLKLYNKGICIPSINMNYIPLIIPLIDNCQGLN